MGSIGRQCRSIIKLEPMDDVEDMDCLPSASSSSSSFSSDTSTSPTSMDSFEVGHAVKPNVNEGVCAVCGDVATGLHYFTASCNGCKTFFRRCVVNDRKFVCRNGGKCSFDKNKRCGCRACRYQKCVDAGMNPQAIQYTPSANLTLSIARKRFTRQGQHHNDIKDFIKHDPFQNTIENKILQTIGYVLRVEEKHHRLRNSNFDPYDNESTLMDYINSKCAYSQSENYQIVEKWPPRPEIEFDKMDSKIKGVKFWYHNDIALGLEYLKTFSFYNDLSVEDKLAWAHSTVIASSLLSSSYYSYSQKSEVIVYPDGSMPFHVKPQNSLIEMEKKFRFSVIANVQELKFDSIQYTLSRAILALNDASPCMSSEARELIAAERNNYSVALLRYLQNKLGTNEGTRLFGDTICFIAGLYRKTEVNKNYYVYRKFIACDSKINSNMMHQLLLDVQ